MTTSHLERKWWFYLPTFLVALFITHMLMKNAGVEHPYNMSQGVLFVFCAGGLQRVFSLVVWLLVLAVTPADKVATRLK